VSFWTPVGLLSMQFCWQLASAVPVSIAPLSMPPPLLLPLPPPLLPPLPPPLLLALPLLLPLPPPLLEPLGQPVQAP
jgi:hypothetical protein